MEIVHKGLEGVIADETSICEVLKGPDRLYYRGYAIEDLVEESTFEEIAYLLLHGELPDRAALDTQRAALVAGQELPQELSLALGRLPAEADPADVLRTGVSILGILEPETKTYGLAEIGPALPAALISMLLAWRQAGKNGTAGATQFGEPTVAGHLLRLSGDPLAELHRRAIDVSLIIYAEHDFNASTYAARVSASTLSDIYSCLTSAIGTLRGPLHGGASAAVALMLDRFEDPDDAERKVLEMLSNKRRVFGFGQRAYAHSDPRNAINKMWAKRLSEAAGNTSLFDIADRIETVMKRERNMFANLDYYTAVIYRLCGLPTAMYPAIFIIARACGIVAHVAEQRSANRLIHPSSKYIGAKPRNYSSIAEHAV